MRSPEHRECRGRVARRGGHWTGYLAVLLALGFGAGIGPQAGATASGDAAEWTRQFGTVNADEAQGVAVDRDGNALVVGWVFGALPGQPLAGMVDAFVRKYDAAGTELWTRQFGSSERDFARGVALDGQGSGYVVGETYGVLPGQAPAGGYDAYVRKYDADGTELWTRQFGGPGGEGAWGAAVDAAGSVSVVGTTRAQLPGQTSAGSFDGFLRKYDTAGTELWTRQFGSAGDEGGKAVALDGDGDILVAGSTDGTLPGQISAGGYDAYVRQFDASGNDLWIRQFGSKADDYGVAVAVDPAGRTLVVGSADRALPGQPWAGGTDAFVRQFDLSGNELWTEQFGTDSTDDAWGVAVDAAGGSYVVGSTGNSLSGQRPAASDFFVRRYDPSGRHSWTRQFGSGDTDLALSVSLDAAQRPRVAGSTRGALDGQQPVGGRDAFVMRLD